ncbi:MAG TPA: glycosyltransferase family 4 protein [Acidimicrobiales bacterium]|nr:glycosyltransferase family 4 protein [Acidimicrobiales bacterium]
MRVAISVPAFLRAADYGGPVTKVALLAKALADRGHAVTVLTADYGPARSRVPADTVVANGYTTHYLKTLARYRWIPVLAPGQLRRIDWDVDVVHVCGLRDGLGIAVISAARRRSIPYVVEPMGMGPAEFRSARLKAAVDRLVTGRQLGAAASVIATSGRERDLLNGQYDLERIDVRPNPVAVSDAPPSAKVATPGAPIDVLFVGRICRTKGLPALVEAVTALEGVRLTIAGPDDADGTSEQLRARASALPPGRLDMRGWVTPHERDELIASSDICVLPSITENFGNFAVEAAARRRPVVVTRTSGVAEFLEDAAMVVEPTVDALRAAIGRLVADPALRDSLAERGLQRAAALGPATIAQAQEDIYARALHG